MNKQIELFSLFAPAKLWIILLDFLEYTKKCDGVFRNSPSFIQAKWQSLLKIGILVNTKRQNRAKITPIYLYEKRIFDFVTDSGLSRERLQTRQP